MNFSDKLNKVLFEEKNKRIFIVHGWGGSSKKGWFSWLKKELKGYDVNALSMPDPSKPHIDSWISHLKKEVGKVDKDTFFVGHSVGCQAILRFLVDNDDAGGAVLVAPWMKLAEDDEEDLEIVKEWEDTPLDLEKIDTDCIAIFSKNDQSVPLNKNVKIFKDKLGASIIKVDKMGHFEEGEIDELPVVLGSLLGML